MAYQVLAPETRPCVWMCAGLLSYKLCERGFDCDRCPLDAALRGRLGSFPSRPSSPLGRRVDRDLFPPDRLYADGHLWVKAATHGDGKGWRVGLDAFAAAVAGCAVAVRWPPPGAALPRGGLLCELDLGLGEPLPLASPLGGTLSRVNEDLRERPGQAVAEPYGAGWLVEIRGLDPGSVLGLHTAAEAAESVRAETLLFRRALAMRLLMESSDEGLLPEGRRVPLSDLREVLGGPRYLELVGQFVH